MFVLTLLLAVGATLLLEFLGRSFMPRAWPAVRWSSLPSTGATMGGIHSMGILTGAPDFDLWLSFAMGGGIGVLVAIAGVFHETFWGGPDEAEVARSGRRSMMHAPTRTVVRARTI